MVVEVEGEEGERPAGWNLLSNGEKRKESGHGTGKNIKGEMGHLGGGQRRSEKRRVGQS